MKLFLLFIIFNLSSIYGKLPNDVRLVIESSEYEALCHQIFNDAIYKLKKKISPKIFPDRGQCQRQSAPHVSYFIPSFRKNV